MDELGSAGLSRYEFEDLVRIKDLLSKRERNIEKQLQQIRFQIKTINNILSLNRSRDETLGVFLPKKFFEVESSNETRDASSKNFNWKSVALKTIQEYNGLMTTDMVYERARIEHPSELTKRAGAIRNFSSALHYLNNSGKLLRYKEIGSREYVYGLASHFDLITNKPKIEYMNKLSRYRESFK